MEGLNIVVDEFVGLISLLKKTVCATALKYCFYFMFTTRNFTYSTSKFIECFVSISR